MSIYIIFIYYYKIYNIADCYSTFKLILRRIDECV